MQLRRAAGDIEGGNGCDGEKAQNAVNGFSAHHFCACRPRLDVAVNTGEITVAPHVDLKNFNRAPSQFVTVWMEFLHEKLHGRSAIRKTGKINLLVCVQGQQVGAAAQQTFAVAPVTLYPAPLVSPGCRRCSREQSKTAACAGGISSSGGTRIN